jgi:hypothetical protein
MYNIADVPIIIKIDDTPLDHSAKIETTSQADY